LGKWAIIFSQCKHIADSAVGVSAVVAGVVECWGAAGSIEELAIMLGLMLVVRLFRLDSDPRESCNWARHVACKCLRFLAAQLIINAWTFSLDLTGLWFASLRLASVCFHFQMQITL